MQLYQRVEEILRLKKVSRTLLAKMLEVPQATLTRYFNDEQQEKLLAYLPRILAIYSEISRNWLYFGEGEMFTQDDPKQNFQVYQEKDIVILNDLIVELEQQVVKQTNIADYEKTEKLRLEEKISQLTQENARLKYQLEDQEIVNKKVS